MNGKILDGSGLWHRASRRGLLTAIAGAPALSLSGALAQSATPAAGGLAVVGAPETGRTAFSVVAMIEQHGDAFTMYGYLTAVADLDLGAIFATSDPTKRDEKTALLTFSATATRIGHFVLQRLFTVHAGGEFLIYAGDKGGASFDKPSSFTRGNPIAKATMRLENVVVEEATGSGITLGSIELDQTAADPFTLAGQSHVFGRTGLLARVGLNGKGTLLQSSKPGVLSLPHAVIIAAGSAVVVR